MDRRAISLYVVIAVLIIGFCRLIGGSNVTMPNAFVNGTVANADHVNANFDALTVGTNDNFARIQTLESEVLDLEIRLANIEAIVDPDLVDRVTALENAVQSQQSIEQLFYVQRSEARFHVNNCPLSTTVSGAGIFILNESQPLSGVTLDVDGSLLFDVPRDGEVLFEVIVEESNGEDIEVRLGTDVVCGSYSNGGAHVVGEDTSALWWRNVISLAAGTHRLTVTGGAFCTSNCGFPCADSRITLNAFTAFLIDG